MALTQIFLSDISVGITFTIRGPLSERKEADRAYRQIDRFHFHIHRFKITLLFKKTEKREKEAGNGPIKKVLFVRPNI